MEDKNNIESKETTQIDQFIGRNPLESYTYWINYEPRNPQTRYTMLIKTITFGMELLPKYIDKEKQEKIDTLYTKAANALKTEIPEKREIIFEHLIRDHRVYRITADDAKPCEAVKEELDTVLNNFINQQHEQHMKMLVEVDSKIFHVLSMNEIVPMVNPTLEEMREGYKKDKFRERHEGNGGNN